jgi:sulfate adenylyltransferase (ADP) / ATP adenylyltransferase
MQLKKGSLWLQINAVTRNALRSGTLHPIPTQIEYVRDCGVNFIVRMISGPWLKDEARKKQEEKSSSGKQANPFLPYEKDLFVTDVSETHIALLNKFNVVDHHLLVVTRQFEDQETLLTLGDFEALSACMAEYPCLGFYNGGEAAGASQRHKHLQIVPLPFVSGRPDLPIEPLVSKLKFKDGLSSAPEFPFVHVFSRLDSAVFKSPYKAGQKLLDLYGRMMQSVGLEAPAGEGQKQAAPYCLLLTRDWMFLVPRSWEFFDSISINSLGFAGALLVRDEDQMQLVKKAGPMSVLREVGLPLHPD